jgi:phosphoadenosine phosphosulfate reductase
MADTSTVVPSESLLSELDEANRSLETAPPGTIIAWAHERFAPDLVLACSFQDIVLVDLAVAVDPGIEVIFLDTGAHFPETLEFVDRVSARYGLNLTVTHPGPEAAAVPCGTDGCCQVRKVAPLRRAVAGRAAWLTALKRIDAPTRAAAPIVSYDEAFGLVKINPMATWTDDDIDSYVTDHDLPVHPLIEKGYLSIGCAPTTRPVAPGEDPRAGRWSGTGKVECGLHG